MLDFVRGQLRGRAGRSVALLIGVLVATTGFAVLTGATTTPRMTGTGTGTVERNARAGYDILIRPKGTRAPPGMTPTTTKAVDRKTVALFVLVLVVCMLVLANAVSAAVRDRRPEMAAAGTLAGVLVTCLAALVPAALLRHLPTARLPAEE